MLHKWPPAGYELGRGDSEPGEVEDVFNNPPAGGAFKAQDQPCHPGFTLVLLLYTPHASSAGSPGTEPQSPIESSPAQ